MFPRRSEDQKSTPVNVDLYTESGQTLQSSFSAVSKQNFESKYSLELGKLLAEIYKIHSFAPFSKLKILFKIAEILAKF